MASWNTWGEDEPYWWVVICKNQKFHRHQNMYSGHKIPLGETDAFTPPPNLDFKLTVCCDECGEEFTYDPAELLRFQMGQLPNFKPHPLSRKRADNPRGDGKTRYLILGRARLQSCCKASKLGASAPEVSFNS